MSFHHFRVGSCCAAVVAAVALFASPGPAAAATEESQSYVNDAKQRLEKGDLRGAEIQLRNAVRANPTDPELHIELAGLYLQIANLPAAEAEARLARQNKGSAAAVDPLLAEALWRQGKFVPLFQAVQPGNRPPKSESAVRLTLGSAHLDLGEAGEAEPLLRDAVRLDDQSARAKVVLARLMLIQGKTDDAEAELAQALAIAPDDASGLRLKADILLANQDSTGALAAIGVLLAKYPDDLGGLFDRADLQMRLGHFDEAQQDLDHALKLAPKNPGAIYLDAMLLAKKGEMKKAQDMIAQISTSFSSFPAGYYLQGAIEYALAQYEQSYASLSKFIARYPNEPSARRLAAMIAARRHDNARIVDLLKPVVAANPTDSMAVNLLAQAYAATGRKNLALELFQRAVQARPNDQYVQTRLAMEHLQTGDIAEGVKQLEQIALTDERGSAAAGPLLVLQDIRLGKLSAAAASANEMLKRNRNDPVAQNLLGVVRLLQHDYPAAIGILKPLAQKETNLSQAQRNLAEAYLGMKQPAEAKKVLEGVLARQPSDEPTLLSLADLAVGTGDYALALDMLDKAQQAQPKDPTPGIRKLQLYAEQKQWDKVAAFAPELEGHFPANAYVLDAVGQARAASGDMKGATEEYRRMTEAFPNSAAAFQGLADAQLRAGDRKGAREALQTAVALAPGQLRHMSALVELDRQERGADAALATARSFAAKQPIAADLLAAGVLLEEKKFDDALALLQQAQERHPDNVIVARLAQLETELGKPQQAVALLEAWTKTHDDPGSWYTLGAIYIHEDEFDKARTVFEHLYDRTPASVPVIFDLAWLYAKKHDPRAHDLAEQGYYLSRTPENADNLGWILTLDGDAKGGLPYLRSANAALPLNPKVQYHLAAALNAVGEQAEARALLAKLVTLDQPFDGRDDARQLFDQIKSH
jgi:cellulose synthase operon protein C